MWHPSVSALTGYRAGRFPAWEQPPGNLHTSKLFLLSTLETLGHLVQSWLALCLSVGSLLPYGPPCRKCSSFRRIYYLILLRPTRATLALETQMFSSRFAAASSSFRLGSSLGVAGSTSWTWSCLACSTDCCHCLLPVISTHERRVISLSN